MRSRFTQTISHSCSHFATDDAPKRPQHCRFRKKSTHKIETRCKHYLILDVYLSTIATMMFMRRPSLQRQPLHPLWVPFTTFVRHVTSCRSCSWKSPNCTLHGKLTFGPSLCDIACKMCWLKSHKKHSNVTICCVELGNNGAKVKPLNTMI